VSPIANRRQLFIRRWLMTRWMIRLALALVLGLFLVIAGQAAWAAEKEPEGKKLFLKYKCNSCHSIDAAGVAVKKDESEEEEESKKKPPDLSGIGVEKKADWLGLFLLKKEKVEGELHPKKFRGTEKELGTITAWLETMKTPSKKKDAKAKTETKAEAKASDESKSEAKEEAEGAKAGSGESSK
jgi:cytochrome c5